MKINRNLGVGILKIRTDRLGWGLKSLFKILLPFAIVDFAFWLEGDDNSWKFLEKSLNIDNIASSMSFWSH
jgi:hypothetical protein